MKVLLRTNPPCDSWVSNGLPKDVLTLLLNSFLANTVLVEDEHFKNTIREVHSRYPQFLSLVLDCIGKTPRVINIRESDIDCVLSSPEDITSIAQSPRFIESLGRHTSIGAPGEARAAFYERSFGHLIRNSKKFVIYDPYAIENLAVHYSGATWLINEELSKLPIHVEIHSLVPKNYVSGESLEACLAYAESTIKKSRNIHPNFSVSVVLYEKTKKGNHDRFARIAFDFNSVSCELSKGAEIFKESTLAEAYKVHTLTMKEFETKAKSWPSDSIIFNENLILN